MVKISVRSASILRDEDGATAVEFALILPLLIVVLCGILTYGGYFWVAHSVQQMANDSARAAVAGLDANERETLARSALAEEIAGSGFDPSLTRLDIDQQANRLQINVTYDASHSMIYALNGIVALPNAQIRRSAATRLAGY